ncbi:hypothetical protein AT984_12330 [Paucibacter sp. KCTC 42545]|nr:hypothetical protein AT984_12330 [Paucibacter sp. KCTC 42545]
MPVTVKHLLRSGSLNPWIGLSMIGFRADWDYAPHLSLILDSLERPSDKAKAAEFYLDKVRLESPTLEAWLAIRKVTVANGLALNDVEAEIARETQRQSAANPKGAREEPAVTHAAKPEASPDWSRVFGLRKLHDHVDLRAAYANYRAQSERNNASEFLTRALDHVQPGEEAAIVAALESFTELDLWDYRRVLSAIPEEWLTRISVRPALRSLIGGVVATHCLDMAPGTFYERLPLDLASHLSGYSRPELCALALDAIGKSHVVLDTQNLFRVVNLLSETMTLSESQTALAYGLELLDSAMRPTDGDGPWKPALSPDATLEANVAGYVWAALASPEASIRWEAAHVVRNLSGFGQIQTLDALVGRLGNPVSGPFADQSLFFYSLHAQQWLLIALARAAQEVPEVVGRHVPVLREIALGREMHVLLRRFAADCLINVARAASGVIDLHPPSRTSVMERKSINQENDGHEEEQIH